jgi:hypothetical protein
MGHKIEHPHKTILLYRTAILKSRKFSAKGIGSYPAVGVQVTQIGWLLLCRFDLSNGAGNTKNGQYSKQEQHSLAASKSKVKVGHGMVLGLQFSRNQFNILSIMNQ